MPLTFAVSVVTSRFLLPEGRGAYVLALLTVEIAARLLSNDAAVVHYLGRRETATRATVTLALVQDGALGALGIAALIPITLVLVGDTGSSAWIAAFGLPASLVTRTMGGALLALGRLKAWNALQLLSIATTLAVMVVLLAGFSLKVGGAIGGWVIAQTVTAVISLAVGRTYWWPLEVRGLPWAHGMSILWLSVRLGSVSLSTLVHYRVELILLQVFVGLKAVGLYSLATSLAELLWIISTSISSAMVAPTLSAGITDAAGIVTRGARHAVLLTAAAGGLLAALASFAVPIVYGKPFGPSRDPLYILIVAAVLLAPGSPLGVYFSAKLGQARYLLLTTFVSAVTTAAFAVWLIPLYGAVGAAISTTIGYGVSELAETFFFLRLSGVRPRELAPQPSDVAAYRDLLRSLVRSRAA